MVYKTFEIFQCEAIHKYKVLLVVLLQDCKLDLCSIIMVIFCGSTYLQFCREVDLFVSPCRAMVEVLLTTDEYRSPDRKEMLLTFIT